MGLAAQRHVRAVFGARAVVASLETLYDELVSHG